ncbi:MAG: transposase [Planctomycetota bacterium]
MSTRSFSLSKNHSLVSVVQAVKAGSSKWLKTQDRRCAEFQWQTGYAAFSVSQSNSDAVRTYIVHQETHHQRKMSFDEELRSLLNKHGIVFDERYVWG